MNVPDRIERSELIWIAGILGTSAAAILAILIGLLYGITTALPHLLYIPVVLGAYRYPRRGAFIAAAIGGIYVLEVVVVLGAGTTAFYEAVLRALVIIVIGAVIALLTRRLREQEDLYEGLFEHSEAGSLLIADVTGNRTIERMNWRASELLRRKISDLTGKTVAEVWQGDDRDDFFLRLSRDGAVYAAETRFALPEEGHFIALVSAATLPGGRAVITFFDITNRVLAEKALQAANDKLNVLSKFSTEHLHRSVDEILETVDAAGTDAKSAPVRSYLDRIRALTWNIARQLFLTDSYKDLGAFPPVWIRVQDVLDATRIPQNTGDVSVRIWAGRLEIEADPLFSDVLTHLLENHLKHGNGSVKNVVVSYHVTPDGLDLIFQDDGAGIPAVKKEQIFDYDAGGHAGIGLFVCRQISEVTGMTLRETGIPGKGARFVIHVPEGRFRIEGTSAEAPAMPVPSAAPRFAAQFRPGVSVRELVSSEFPVAEELWIDYHNTKGDRTTDRIFAAFHDGKAVSLARCRKHPDGLEVDGVFTPANQRGSGYARDVVKGLIEACGHETLYMHSVLNLTGFYGTFGFVTIGEKELPQTIRDRFAWAGGEMEGANVQPMKRVSPQG